MTRIFMFLSRLEEKLQIFLFLFYPQENSSFYFLRFRYFHERSINFTHTHKINKRKKKAPVFISLPVLNFEGLIFFADIRKLVSIIILKFQKYFSYVKTYEGYKFFSASVVQSLAHLPLLRYESASVGSLGGRTVNIQVFSLLCGLGTMDTWGR